MTDSKSRNTKDKLLKILISLKENNKNIRKIVSELINDTSIEELYDTIYFEDELMLNIEFLKILIEEAIKKGMNEIDRFFSIVAKDKKQLKWAKTIIENSTLGDPSYAAANLFKNKLVDKRWLRSILIKDSAGDPSGAAFDLLSSWYIDIDFFKEVVESDNNGKPIIVVTEIIKLRKDLSSWVKKIIEEKMVLESQEFFIDHCFSEFLSIVRKWPEEEKNKEFDWVVNIIDKTNNVYKSAIAGMLALTRDTPENIERAQKLLEEDYLRNKDNAYNKVYIASNIENLATQIPECHQWACRVSKEFKNYWSKFDIS